MAHASTSRYLFPCFFHVAFFKCHKWRMWQGARDAQLLYKTLQIIYSEALLPGLEDGFFTVHMAILTANVGKWLSVEDGCLLGSMLDRLSVASLNPRTDEQCNTEIFSILDWKICECMAKLGELQSEDLEELNKTWNNTVSVTSKGAVIIRFSWNVPVQWSEKHKKMALCASRLACWMIRNCA